MSTNLNELYLTQAASNLCLNICPSEPTYGITITLHHLLKTNHVTGIILHAGRTFSPF